MDSPARRAEVRRTMRHPMLELIVEFDGEGDQQLREQSRERREIGRWVNFAPGL